MTFTLFMGAVRKRLAIIDSRCLTTNVPMILPHGKITCDLPTQAPPRRVNGRGHGNGSEVPMRPQSTPPRKPSACALKLAVARWLRRSAARLEFGLPVDTLPEVEK